jgi:hypothetical protein
MCLDYNRVTGKLRALVLDDAEYKQETRNIYAKQRLEELQEIDSLAKLVVGGEDEEDYDPRNKGKKKKGGVSDKDMLAIRFKAAQMRRELVMSLNNDAGASERDAINLLFVGLSDEEILENVKSELYEGTPDGALDTLAQAPEEAPAGTSGKLRKKRQNGELREEDMFETLPDGAIVER